MALESSRLKTHCQHKQTKVNVREITCVIRDIMVPHTNSLDGSPVYKLSPLSLLCLDP